MASIAETLQLFPDTMRSAEPFDWAGVATSARDWALARGIALRDVIVLLPFAQLLAPARTAWARQGGWMPRIETTLTLARALAPPPLPEPGQIAFDSAMDALAAERLLATQAWARALASRDAATFQQAIGALVETAQALARAAAAVEPARREAHWQRARALLAAAEGAGRVEQALLRVACEWAATSAPPATDALFALRPSAWIVVRAGGAERLVEALLHRGEVPRLVIDTDAPLDAPFAAVPATSRIALASCDDFEDEAQRSAAEVLRLLAAGASPLALIATDRSLVRRIRALLERHGVALQDETGWRLSTTRGAARLMALLRAMAPQASGDELLDWLKAGVEEGQALPHRASATSALEAALRRRVGARVATLHADAFDAPAAQIVQAVQSLRRGFDATRARSLLQWHAALRTLLEASGDAAGLRGDVAGTQVLAALRLADGGSEAAAWLDIARTMRLDYDALLRWVDRALEEAAFIAAPSAQPEVVITPPARAMLRPFAAIVCPGADERHLGAGSALLPLLDDARALALGLDGAAARRDAELLAFVQLLRAPRLSLLRRASDGGEPLAPSPLLERLGLALRRAGRGFETLADAREQRALVQRPRMRPAPAAAALLPARLSASAVEALRECPYRFFALRLLGLQERDELERDLGQRDYGSWLHAVLRRFHEQRAGGPTPTRDEDVARLQAAADFERDAQGLDAAEFLPYAATFERCAPLYVDWLHERETAGSHYREGEVEIAARPAALGGVELIGRIDRIDHGRGAALELIDYKSGDVAKLRTRLKQPTEDTQLAFYAVLLRASRDPPGPLVASYLGLDVRERIVRIEHPEVEASAGALLEGLGRDLERLRAGAGLPALGEGEVCDYCAARGLCRRDDWSVP